MRKKLIATVGTVIISMVCGVLGVQPNYVETTTHHVNGDVSPGVDITSVTTQYSDGLGRPIQTKAKHPVGNDITTCSFYDAAGRLEYTTKTFIDNSKKGEFLPGDLHDAAFFGQLIANYNNDIVPYSATVYWDNPLGLSKIEYVPGMDNTDIYTRQWTFGVDTTVARSPVVNRCHLRFESGIVTEVNVDTGGNIESVFDRVHHYVSINQNVFPNPQFYLTVTLDAEGKISESLVDIAGKSIKTFVSPSVTYDDNSSPAVIGKKIASYTHYDISGNVLKETPPLASNVLAPSEYRYNTLKQLIWKKTPDRCEEEYTYREDGQLDNVLEFRMNGTVKETVRRIGYIYDKYGRVQRIYASYPETDSLDVTNEVPYGQIVYSYDNVEVLQTSGVFADIPASYVSKLSNLKGRLVTTETVHYMKRGRNNIECRYVGEAYSYDEDGRVQSKYTIVTGSPLFQVTYYTYDIHGKILMEAFSYGGDQFVKRYTYDQLGRLWYIEQGKSLGNDNYDYVKIVENEYDALGRLKNKKLSKISGDYQTEYAYDILERITAVSTHNKVGGQPETFSERIWKYDLLGDSTTGFSATGNITNVRYNYGANVVKKYDYEYSYDYLNRLTGSAEKIGGVTNTNSYTYDTLGRFRTKVEGASTVTGYNYYTANNRLKKTSKNSTSTSIEYIYDNHGNLVVDFTKKMVIEYDWRDLPLFFRFYQSLTPAGLTKNPVTGTYIGENLYEEMRQKTENGTVALQATVMMLYDADGNRVCKMDVKE